MTDLATATTESLLQEYVREAARHGEATEGADKRSANAAADAVAAIYRELRRRGPEAQSTLLVLLDHPDPGVRSWAGAHALEFAPDEGLPVLEQLARENKGLIGFGAETTIEVWRSGELVFP
jgi:hypothetical protein